MRATHADEILQDGSGVELDLHTQYTETDQKLFQPVRIFLGKRRTQKIGAARIWASRLVWEEYVGMAKLPVSWLTHSALPTEGTRTKALASPCIKPGALELTIGSGGPN